MLESIKDLFGAAILIGFVALIFSPFYIVFKQGNEFNERLDASVVRHCTMEDLERFEWCYAKQEKLLRNEIKLERIRERFRGSDVDIEKKVVGNGF